VGKEEELKPGCTHPLAFGVAPFLEQAAGAEVPPMGSVSALGVGEKQIVFCWGRKRFPRRGRGKREATPSAQPHIVLQDNVLLGRTAPGLNQNLLARKSGKEASKRHLTSLWSSKAH